MQVLIQVCTIPNVIDTNKIDDIYDFSPKENPDQTHFSFLPDNKFDILSIPEEVSSDIPEHLYDTYPNYLITRFSTSEEVIDRIKNSVNFEVNTNSNNSKPQIPVSNTEVLADDDIQVVNDDIKYNNNSYNNPTNIILDAGVSNINTNNNNKEYDNLTLENNNFQYNNLQMNNLNIYNPASYIETSENLNNQGSSYANNFLNMNSINISLTQDDNLDPIEQEALKKVEEYKEKQRKKLKEKMEKELQLKNDIRNSANNYLEKWITYLISFTFKVRI